MILSKNTKGKIKLSHFILTTILFFQLSIAFPESINVNFTGARDRDVTGSAGVVPAVNWNNFGGTTGSGNNLIDDGGTATDTDIQWTATASWFSGTPEGTQDANLMDGYLAVNVQTYDYGVSITNIPYNSYDVYAYFGCNNMGANGKIRINDEGTEYFYKVAGILPTFNGFQNVTSISSTDPGLGNYCVFTNIVGGSLTIKTAMNGGGADSGLMGFQIVDAGDPEPQLFLDKTMYKQNESINIEFNFGPGDAENNFVIVDEDASPTGTVLKRIYVGGTSSPTTANTNGTIELENAADLEMAYYDIYFLSDASGSPTILEGPITFRVVVPDPQAIAVGGGSYAEYPPIHEGDGPLEMVWEREIYVVDENQPIPTNDWWTDLVISQYAGVMWASPLAVSADNKGMNIFWPTEWNTEGTSLKTENPIEIFGEVEPDGDPTMILIADFEGGSYPAGWVLTGTCFGSVPASGEVSGQSVVGGFLGEGFANSFHGGDGSTGSMTSTNFTINRDYIHFLIGGGNHPAQTCINLVIGGSTVITETGENSEHLEWARWDVSAYAGQTAHIEIIDTATGGWGHVLIDQVFQSDNPDDPSSLLDTEFSPVDARALDWSDWIVSMRMTHSSGKYIDATFGHGLPYVWIEPHNVTPIVKLNTSATFFDIDGNTTTLPKTSDNLGIVYDGRNYGLFMPDDTTVAFADGQLTFTFSGADKYLVISPLPAKTDINTFYETAYAVPRDSIYSWQYNPEAAIVSTTWELTTEALKGTNTQVIQGWIPHHYRRTTSDLSFNTVQYNTARGLMKCTTGNQFTITYPFIGMLPNLTAPEQTGKANDYQVSRMENYLTDYATITEYGGDTYWGGKNLVEFGKYMLMADAMDHSTSETLKNSLKTALEDWFTYTDGEEEHYFAYYPNWKSLIGFNESYWSYQFTDNHFHYGYYTLSSALLGMLDPQFLNDYGEMVTLVAKQYANWDRSDTRFPFLRTFDIWAGHSLAGGFSSPGGNNQESTSEAMQSWGGLFLLGQMLENDEMTAVGAMGYAVESKAIMEYWFDINGDILPTAYNHSMVGILFDGGQAYATFFSGDPAWIHGIQWLPVSPMCQAYIVEDLPFAQQEFNNMKTERSAAVEGPVDIDAIGTSLGNVILGFELQFDPDSVAQQCDELWDSGSPVMHDNYTGGETYYYTHAVRTLGFIQWNYHMNIPTGTVFYNADSDTTSYVAYNPKSVEQIITVYKDGEAIGTFTVPARTLKKVTILDQDIVPVELTDWYAN